MSFLIRNGQVIDPARGLNDYLDIFIENGKICEIGKNLDLLADEVYDATGKVVAPGLVDMHCHLRDPGQEHKGDIVSEGWAALHGGFTSIVCMPNTSPAVDNPEVVRYICEKETSVHVYPTGSATRRLEGSELTDFTELKKAGIVAISDDGMPIVSNEMLEKALLAAKNIGLPLIYHSEDFGKDSLASDAEWADVARAVAIAEKVNAPIHITHISSKETVEIISEAKARGASVTADTCPHYFSLTKEARNKFGANAKMNPPLKDEEDISAIIAGLKDGTIDAISTDHAPHATFEKQSESPPNGIIGFETALGLGITKLVKTGHLTLQQLIEKMSANPARLVNLPKDSADLVVIDENLEWEVLAENFKSKSKNSPFIREKLTGKAVASFVSNSREETTKLYHL